MIKLLPIGSVVMTDIESNEKIMILGKLVRKQEEGEIFDYCACIAPFGVQTQENLRFFNHEEIKRLLFIGFQDEEELQYSLTLSVERTKIKESNNKES
ncbi:MAG: DUF4176 domain-containing protein [Clostridium sp.]